MTMFNFSIFGWEEGRTINEHSPFANSYLPIAYFQDQSIKKLPIPLQFFFDFESMKVTVTYGPIGVLRPPS